MALELQPFGKIVWEDRYGLKDELGGLIEKDIQETFLRVAKAVSAKEKDPLAWSQAFYEIMAEGYFCPAGRILAHSGTHYSQLLNCFVLPFKDDSLESIMQTAGAIAITQKYGGGVGLSYSRLRPSGSYIKGVNGRSCGVIGFLSMNSVVSEVIEQGGSRRGANLGLLEVWHPDIWEFISYKTEHNWDSMREFIEVKDEEQWAAFKYENLYKWQMYNVSVGVNDDFFRVLKEDGFWPLMWNDKEWELYTVVFKKKTVDGYREKRFEVTADGPQTAIWKAKKKIPFPTSKDIVEVESHRKIKASEIWERLCYNAWADGCPGLLNMSTIRKYHNLEYARPIEATNPCLHGDSLMLTSGGLRVIKELEGQTPIIWNGSDWVKSSVFCSGVKSVYEMRMSNGMFLKATLDHRVADILGQELMIGNALGQEISRLPGSLWQGLPVGYSDIELICLGFSFGDGQYHGASGRYKYIHIGADDGDVEPLFNDAGEPLEVSGRSDKRLMSVLFADKCAALEFPEVSLPERYLSDRILQLPPEQLLKFLKGLYSANGSVLEVGRVTYKSTCRKLIDQLQVILAAFDIRSYVTTNKAHETKFSNGVYLCRESYDLNIISTDLFTFKEKVGFIQGYKNDRLNNILRANKSGRRLPSKVVSVKYLGEEKVYDFTESVTHWAFVNGLKVHNCGEQPLPANSSCLLSSLVLASFVKNKAIDYNALEKAVRVAVRFMDDVIDNCEFPIKEIGEAEYSERRIGLGTMGVHDMLIALEQCYDSETGRNTVEAVLAFIRDTAYSENVQLAKEKGTFPLYDRDKYMQSEFIKTLPEKIRQDIYLYGVRCSCVLSQAPTGTIGALFNVSTGCEPWFSLVMQRNTRLGSYEDGCPAYLKWKNENPGAPIPPYFRTAQDISPEDHIKMLVLFSKYIDSAVSKTINLANSATVKDVSDAFLMAMSRGVKGITVFRDGSKEGVLVSRDKDKNQDNNLNTISELKPDPNLCDDVIEQIDSRIAPKKRGNRVQGATTRVHMQHHNLYVTVNKNVQGDVIELFATVGESKKPNTHHTSGVEDSWAEGLGKIASLALRAGVHVGSIIRNLKNIPSDKPVFTTIGDCENSELVPSPPHAVARVLEEEVKYHVGRAEKIEDLQSDGVCAECGSTNIKKKSPTCYECLDCSYSGCGG